jgi:hypothetical protein
MNASAFFVAGVNTTNNWGINIGGSLGVAAVKDQLQVDIPLQDWNLSIQGYGNALALGANFGIIAKPTNYKAYLGGSALFGGGIVINLAKPEPPILKAAP